MKVTKLTNGYRIRVTDSEFDALKAAALHGIGVAMHDKEIGKTLSGRARSVLKTERFAHPEGPLGTVDEERREEVKEAAE